MVKARAVMKVDSGEISFIVECAAFDVATAMKRIKEDMDEQFDYCFDADKWKTVEITLTRS